MFKFRTSGLFAFMIIFWESFYMGQSSHAVVSGSSDATGSNNSTDRQNSVEYSDYAEIPTSKKLESSHFDYYNLVVLKNKTNTRVVINKCCQQDYYFSMDEFVCVRSGQNTSNSNFFIENFKNESNYLFIDSIPECGSEFVITARLSSNFSVGITGVAIDGEVFSKYCIDESPEHPHDAVVVTCNDPKSFCKTRTCFRKCCSLGYSYALSGRRCQKSNQPFKPEIYNLTSLARAESSGFGIYLGDACGTKGKYILERDAGEVSYLGEDGKLFVPILEKKIYLESEFCVEFVKIGNQSGVESFLCFSKTGTHFENSQLQFFLLSLGFIISCMFLLFTFLVYLFSPKSRNLYGKTLMCYITCLFSAYLCLAVIELKSREIDKNLCTNLGYSMLFSFLAAFFWLNVMSFDIWKTFRSDRTVEKSKTEKRKSQFIWYSLYAWSFPSAITGVCAYANQAQGFPFEVIKPYIGEENCWFSKKRKGIYVFFIAPISLIISLNIIFYLQTAWKIWKVKSDVKRMETQKTKKFSANKDQFIINGKLFIVMGITWSLEIISFFAPHPIWYVTDTANALHGVFIFAVFVLKKKVLHQVSQQVRAPLKRMRQLTTSNSDDLSTRKNFQDLNTEGKSYETGVPPPSKDSTN